MVAGIGCSGQIRNYLNGNGFHGAHGAPLAYALGASMANPDLTVLTLAGDGDTLAIGMENFIHCCRRDPNLTLIIMNNGVYGLTKGQNSPTTGLGQDIKVFTEEHPPFAVVNDFSPCVTYNKFNTYDWYKTNVEDIPDSHDPSDKAAAWALLDDFDRRGKQPLGVVYHAPRKKIEAKRLPIWDEEFQNVDPTPMLKPFM
jgi:2-oxoglutarate ferredoxin oxidoreductase subunit beta